MKVKTVLLGVVLALVFSTGAAADPITIVVNLTTAGLDVTGLGWGQAGGRVGSGAATVGLAGGSDIAVRPNRGNRGGNNDSSSRSGALSSRFGDIFINEISNSGSLFGADSGVVIGGPFGLLVLLHIGPSHFQGTSPAGGLVSGGGGGTSVTPEPATLLLVGSGLIGVGTSMRYRRRKPAA